mgnify:CR=1 FL=1
MPFMSPNVKETVVHEASFDIPDHSAQASGQMTTDDHCKCLLISPLTPRVMEVI